MFAAAAAAVVPLVQGSAAASWSIAPVVAHIEAVEKEAAEDLADTPAVAVETSSGMRSAAVELAAQLMTC